MFNLKNKTIIITGGAGLIGKAFVETCLKQDANVVAADVARPEKCDITKVADSFIKSALQTNISVIFGKQTLTTKIENSVALVKKVAAYLRGKA